MQTDNLLIIVVAIVLICVVMAAVCFGGGTRGTFHDFTGPDVITNQSVSTQAITNRGLPMVIHFWSTQCPACKVSMAYTVQLVKKYQSQITPLAVALDYEKDKALLKQIIRDYGITYPVLCMGAGWYDPAATLNHINAIPTLILVDKDGISRYKGRDLRELEKEMKKVCGE
jgi:thiol-disulfide isomerase/thioredoxin